MNIWLASDYHFGCENFVARTRPEFASIEDHDQHLIEQTNRLVKPHDLLLYHGDFCQEKPGKYRQQIKCKHWIFILGNHDRETKIRRVFGGSVYHSRVIKLPYGNRLFCSHYPHVHWNGSHNGWYHSYGHTHANWHHEFMMDRGMPGRRSMDVGVDFAKGWLGEYRPIALEEFMSYLKGRPGYGLVFR